VRLAKIEQEFGEAVEVIWKSFLLRPHPEPKPLEKFRRYTESWMRPAGQPDGGRFRVWSTDEAPPSHSVPPNVAVKAAARQGAFGRYHLALMDAYFYQNRNVTSADTIVAVAQECGLDMEAFVAALRDPETAKAVVRDHNEAVEAGITGVPAVVVEGGMQIPGAQDLVFYRHLVAKCLEKRNSA
jgi:predicted DsbA family dithiol-disulfide isomerase